MRSRDRVHLDALAGVLLVLAPTPMAVAGRAWHGLAAPRLMFVLPAVLGVLFVTAGMGRLRFPRASVAFGLVASLGTAALLLPHAIERPIFALLSLLGLTLLVRSLWLGDRLQSTLEVGSGPHRGGEISPWRSVALGAALGALLLWAVTALARWQDDSAVALSVLASQGIALALLAPWVFERYRHRRGPWLFLISFTVAFVFLFIIWGRFSTGLAAMAALLLFAVWLLRRFSGDDLDWWELVLENPQRLLVVTFLGLSMVGALVLSLPISMASGRHISALDAIFTAVSAVCVTGLVVKDTAVDFSGVGQLFILLMIQAGGLGIMTFSTAAMRVLGRRMSLRQEGAVAGILSAQRRGEVYGATRRLLRVTFVVQALGVLLLFPAFLGHGDSFGRALWRALFTSVSAFCNAGFALQSESLIGFAESPWVLHVVAALIITGALSPSAVVALPQLLRRRPIPLQDKMGLVSTAVLLLGGFMAMLATEWNGALVSLGYGDRLHNAWFQSVTLRTAGFNSIDYTILAPATLTMMMLWMFVGGNPGGTAGGVKTTTVATLLLGVVTAIRGGEEVSIYGRQIPPRTVYRAAAITTIALAMILGALSALQLTQALTTRLLSYEVVSAMSTVGLSVGATSGLDGLGKVVIIICMFVGRIGSLTLFMFLGQRTQHTPWRYPEEEIDVG